MSYRITFLDKRQFHAWRLNLLFQYRIHIMLVIFILFFWGLKPFKTKFICSTSLDYIKNLPKTFRFLVIPNDAIHFLYVQILCYHCHQKCGEVKEHSFFFIFVYLNYLKHSLVLFDETNDICLVCAKSIPSGSRVLLFNWFIGQMSGML